jgi:uncharacterized protein with von Willebrand factor type A (vWA) domain
MQRPESPPVGGSLAANILRFCRTLRQAGVPLGPGEVVEALGAVRQTGLGRRDDFYYALRATLVKNSAHFRVFHQAFHVYFRNPRLLERAMALLLPEVPRDESSAPAEQATKRLLEALGRIADGESEETETAIDRSQSWSQLEVLRKKDFEQMSLAELSEARALLQREITPLAAQKTRRYRPDPVGHRYDLRRSMQLMTRNNGQLLTLARKRRRLRRPPVVLLCDISGSMSAYSRVFLYFAHALATVNPRVHTLVFATRLTNVTRHLETGDADQALAAAARDVRDWDGGTRIASCFECFNLDWNRRLLAQNAVVVLLTDGLERDSADMLARQTERIRRSCRQLIWLNPMLRYRDFRPQAAGIRAMLPHVDRFLPAHNLRSIVDLIGILDQAGAPHARADATPSAWTGGRAQEAA